MTPPGTPPVRKRRGLGRLLRRGGAAGSVRVPDDDTLVLLGRAFEVERGDAVVLAQIAAVGGDLTRPVLLRHVFAVRAGADVGGLVAALRAEGYAVVRPEPGTLTASAAVLLTPLSAAQARARMTGLTTRHPLDYLGWEAWQPPG